MAEAEKGEGCPLCGSEQTIPYHADSWRSYRCCTRCGFVYVPRPFHLAPAVERAEYDRHDNAVDDPGYRRFLARVADPLTARVPAPAYGLDFGCGPGPALAAMLRERGYRMAVYDPFYAPDPAVLVPGWDFITATEVVEHLAAPGAELQRLAGLLRPGGWLGLMTKLVLDRERFATWHYIRDPTHIGFFSRPTLAWWAAAAGLEPPVFAAADVILLRRPDRAAASSRRGGRTPRTAAR
ncbi:MAG TPA: class I SAM-dependent methyltransferase [Gammaproteobacteria bacterium]|nr:class I SAM-dependent methyltransferase [Gammaproteobacteria bacterium]